MKNKKFKNTFLLSIFAALLFVSCEKPNQELGLGHALRVIVYYKCSNYSTNASYPGAPDKAGYGIYQVILKLDNDILTDELLVQMNEFIDSCGITEFDGHWYSDYDLTTPLTAGPLTSHWEDNYYNYIIYTKVEEDLTPRFTEWIVRDSCGIYRLNTSEFDIYPLDTSTVNFSDELQRRSYIPYNVGSVYYIDPQTNTTTEQWQPGDPLQGKKIFVDLTSEWSEQRYNIKFINTVKKFYPFDEPYYQCDYIKNDIKVKDYIQNKNLGSYEYLNIYKGIILSDGDIMWFKDEPLTDDDTIELYDLIRVETCRSFCSIYIIDDTGFVIPLVDENNSDIQYEFKEDTISDYDLGDVGKLVFVAGYLPVNIPNSSFVPKAYYRVNSSGAASASTDTVWSINGDTYVQIKKGCRTSKLDEKIYILVESL